MTAMTRTNAQNRPTLVLRWAVGESGRPAPCASWKVDEKHEARQTSGASVLAATNMGSGRPLFRATA